MDGPRLSGIITWPDDWHSWTPEQKDEYLGRILDAMGLRDEEPGDDKDL